MKKEKIFKVLRIVKKIVETAFVVLLIAFISMVCLQRFSGNKISILDYRLFTVVTGSMKPKYNIGDVLISKEVDPADIKVGDVISYLGEKYDFKDKVITHEVISIERDTDGKYLFHAKGKTNLVEDPIVHERQLYGVVTYRSIILSFVYRIVGTTYGLLFFVVLPIFYIIGSEMVIFMLSKEEKRREKITTEE